MTNLEDRLKLEAQIQAQEARSQRATVREIYQAVTGRTGEPGDWHGSQPVLALIEERDALRRMSSEFGAALITARARVAELELGAECWAIVSSGMLPKTRKKYEIAARSNLKH